MWLEYLDYINLFEHQTSDPKWSSMFLCLQCWTPAGGVGGLGYIAGVKLVLSQKLHSSVAKLHAVPDRVRNMSNHGQCPELGNLESIESRRFLGFQKIPDRSDRFGWYIIVGWRICVWQSIDRTSATVGPLSTDVEWEAKVSRKVWAWPMLMPPHRAIVPSAGREFD